MPSPDASDPLIEVSIVMPCLNEARTLASCIREALAMGRQSGLAVEVVVADNGSTDGSTEIAIAEGARLVRVPLKGYGHALRHGIEAARGKYIIMGDADMSYDFSHAPRFVERLRAGADLVMGNRFLGGIEKGAMPWKNRYIGNPVLSWLGRLLFRTPVRDFHCGLRGFTAEAYRKMELQTAGMEFASEMVIKAALLGLRTEEAPTVLRPDGRDRPPHLRPWRDGWRHLRFMLLFSPRWLFLYPGITLLAVGLVGSGLLLPGPFVVQGVVFDVHSLLFAATTILVGFQAVSLAVLSKRFAIHAGLRRPEPRFDRMMEYVSLEGGLVAGALLIMAGALCTFFAVWTWREQHFGNLVPSQTLRLAIPGCTLVTLGFQTVFTCFFLGVLRLDHRAAVLQRNDGMR